MRLLRDMDVIEIVDRNTRKDGTLDEDISVILEEVETAFDKEKVKEELTAGKFITIGGNTVGESVNIRIDRAVEIVEKGGIK